ncbi:MAG: hypothetical protein CMN55_04230 [Sneathiella sp.]|jgi:hypothetical protein|uniref:hypothetical protein n=1 Tax=Sneathiella sp. TaxID=1964365 RepID=UPI000C3A3397|nr:hypothetical protein [Sneathiella sp.]MAL78305.1 hypothetical protein [Sneathiella sp.]
MRGSGILAITLITVLLGACAEKPLPGVLPPVAATNGVTAMSTLLSFTRTGAEGRLQTSTGLSLETALLRLRQDPPTLVTLQAYGADMPTAQFMPVIKSTSLANIALVEVRPAIAAGRSRLELEITYYRYRLADCGADLAYRKLDYVARSSPGFGCAVEQNRMLNLAYPGEWYQGRRLAPPLAARDAAAASRYFAAEPRSMPVIGR